jgi:hypothetical protein
MPPGIPGVVRPLPRLLLLSEYNVLGRFGGHRKPGGVDGLGERDRGQRPLLIGCLRGLLSDPVSQSSLPSHPGELVVWD